MNDEDYFSEVSKETDEDFAFDAADVAAINAAQSQYVVPEEFKLETTTKTSSVIEMFRTILQFVLIPIDMLFGIAITIIAELVSLMINVINYALQAIARNIKDFLLTVFNALVTGVFTTLQVFLCAIIAPVTGLIFCSIGAMMDGVLWGINMLFMGIREAICGLTKGLYFIFTGLDAVFQGMYDIACSAIENSSRVLTKVADEATGLLGGSSNSGTLNSISTTLSTVVNYGGMPMAFVSDTEITGEEVAVTTEELNSIETTVKVAEASLPSSASVTGIIESVFGLANSLISGVVEYIPYFMLGFTLILVIYGVYLVRGLIKRKTMQLKQRA